MESSVAREEEATMKCPPLMRKVCGNITRNQDESKTATSDPFLIFVRQKRAPAMPISICSDRQLDCGAEYLSENKFLFWQ